MKKLAFIILILVIIVNDGISQRNYVEYQSVVLTTDFYCLTYAPVSGMACAYGFFMGVNTGRDPFYYYGYVSLWRLNIVKYGKCAEGFIIEKPKEKSNIKKLFDRSNFDFGKTSNPILL